MLYYILILYLIKYIGDELYDDGFDLNWFRYANFLVVVLGGIAYFSY